MQRDTSEDLDAGLSEEETAFTPSMTVPRHIAHSSTGAFGHQSPMREVDLLQKLLEVLLSFPDRSLAVSAATKALNILRHGQEEHAPEDACAKHSGSGERLTRETSADVESDLSPTWEAASVPDALASSSRKSDGSASEPRPERRELASVIDEYPLCKRLMEAYRRVYHMPNKTPLSILFEYASRLNLQLSFEEGQTSQGHFTLTLQLKNDREACLYRPGVGQAKSKKDAKQLAAAALLEVMLDHVPFQDLLYKSEKQQSFKEIQAQRSHPHAMPKGRAPRLGQRHSGGNLSYRGYPASPPLQVAAGSLSIPQGYSAVGLSGAYGGLHGMGSTIHMHSSHADSEVPPFDMGYRQDHRLLLGRAGSDPTLGFPPTLSCEGGHRSAALAMMHPDQQMHQEFLCNGLGLPGMPQQPMQSHLQYQHATLDPSLAANMAHLGLGQCSVMDNLQGTTWQADLMASTMPLASSASPLGLPPQHHAMPQSTVSLPAAAAFNLASLPSNTMQ
ncbi:g6673 [Coccomyxa viridis]|uniref:G6673 protein n=1 Tax=Coccomyxa viridis TaxID=1274662 RepID=A0ABP1FVY1_9CHLO